MRALAWTAARVDLARDAQAAGFEVPDHSILRDLGRALLKLVETIDDLAEVEARRLPSGGGKGLPVIRE